MAESLSQPHRPALLAALVVVGISLLTAVAPAQIRTGSGRPDGAGGTYGGPGDTVPGGGRPSGGGAPPPPSSGPSQPSGPATPGPSSPPPAAANPGSPSVSPRGLAADQDLSTWDHWWRRNADAYLAFASALRRLHPVTEAADALADPLARRRAGLTWNAVYGEVVPLLLETLETERDQRILRAAILALGRIGEAPPFERAKGPAPAILPHLLPFLRDGNRGVAEAAVIALGVLGSEEATHHLVHLARDEKPGRALCGNRRVPLRVRTFACYGLAIAGSQMDRPAVSRRAVQHLAAVLQEDGDGHPDLQAACVIGIGLLPLPNALESSLDIALAPSFAGDAPSARRDSQVDYLLDLLVDEHAPLVSRAHAPTAIVRLLVGAGEAQRARATEILTSMADRQGGARVELRRSALIALGRLGDADGEEGDRAIRAALLAGADDPDPIAKGLALVSLARVGARAGSGDRPLEAAKDVSAFLAGRVEDGASRVRPWAGLAMGVFGRELRDGGVLLDRAASDALLVRATGTRTPEDAAAFAIGAGLAGEQRAREALVLRLHDVSEAKWQGLFAVALGLMGDPKSVAALRLETEHVENKPGVMEGLAIARALLDDKQLVPDLLELLGKRTSGLGSIGVTRALAWTGDHRALDPLMDLVRDDERGALDRAEGIVALGWICDKERVVWDARISVDLNYTLVTPTLTDPSYGGILDTL